MTARQRQPATVFILGPTASGKSALALQIAEALPCEIISVDSALVYRGMDIGTAKPTLQERTSVRHHLIDILDPAEAFSTGQFRAKALAAMQDITGRGKIPLLVGGTMLYFHALLHGLAELPAADAAVREMLDRQAVEHGWQTLLRRLAEVDPESAQRIHPNDPQRIQRALEVYQLSGRPLSELIRKGQAQDIPYHCIKLVVAPEHRPVLHEQIARRFRQMLEQGLVEEVEVLFRRGDLTTAMPSIRAVGYRQVWSYLAGEYDYRTMTEKAIIATRQLAKRQFTWLRRQTDAVKLAAGRDDLLETALGLIERHVRS